MEDHQGRGPEPVYSQVYRVLHKYYGQPKLVDGDGSCFRGPKGETAILTDNGKKDQIHEVVIVGASINVVADLEKIIGKQEEHISK